MLAGSFCGEDSIFLLFKNTSDRLFSLSSRFSPSPPLSFSSNECVVRVILHSQIKSNGFPAFFSTVKLTMSFFLLFFTSSPLRSADRGSVTAASVVGNL